ncbi:MAG: hypothetical protein HN590_00290 [Calditrichaeota bacterium]|nr:hypothetical protein [Calditrichota bacterium]MBT7788759.1 hypothetical protein [Calditrichota bacterium]
MTPEDFKIINAKEKPELEQLNSELAEICWPEFMRQDPVAVHFNDLYRNFADFQFGLEEKTTGRIVAIGNSIPLFWKMDFENLPDDGWDWVIERGVKDRFTGKVPNMLSAIQVMIIPEFQGKGLSKVMVQAMKDIGVGYGFKTLIAPVRPSQKCEHPKMSMERYIKLKNDKGLPYDAWMRVHASLGARIVKVCPLSMRITGTVEEWEKWTGQSFPETGEYDVPEALVPITIDLSLDMGIYNEPNVWMVHEGL